MKDLKSSFRSSIKDKNRDLDVNHQNEILSDSINTSKQNVKLKLSKKKDLKINKKSFPVYLDDERNYKLDKVCKKTGYSKNELIIKFIDFGLENLELED